MNVLLLVVNMCKCLRTTTCTATLSRCTLCHEGSHKERERERERERDRDRHTDRQTEADGVRRSLPSPCPLQLGVAPALMDHMLHPQLCSETRSTHKHLVSPQRDCLRGGGWLASSASAGLRRTSSGDSTPCRRSAKTRRCTWPLPLPEPCGLPRPCNLARSCSLTGEDPGQATNCEVDQIS